jgi:hypothetical protein
MASYEEAVNKNKFIKISNYISGIETYPGILLEDF